MVVASIERPVKIHESPKKKGKSKEHGNVSSFRGNVIELLAARRCGEVGTLKGNRRDMRKFAARKYQGRAGADGEERAFCFRGCTRRRCDRTAGKLLSFKGARSMARIRACASPSLRPFPRFILCRDGGLVSIGSSVPLAWAFAELARNVPSAVVFFPFEEMTTGGNRFLEFRVEQ